jgi:hypothetical protein
VTHIERHEEIILNHIDGSVDEQNLDEALHLLKQCDECNELYKNSLILRSQLHRTNLLHYLSGKETAVATEAPEYKQWSAVSWRSLVIAAIVWLVGVLPLGWYMNQLRKELRGQVSALQADKEKIMSQLAILKQDNKKLEGKIEELEAVKSRAEVVKPMPAPATLKPVVRSFWNPHTVALILSDIRSQEAPNPVALIEFPKDADLLQLTLSIPEEKIHRRYDVVITGGESDAVLQKYENVKRDRFGNFNLYFPRNFFTHQAYRIKIFGFEGNQSTLLAQQQIRVK